MFYAYGIRDSCPIDLFLGIFLLFQLENVFVEIKLKILVRVIDT